MNDLGAIQTPRVLKTLVVFSPQEMGLRLGRGKVTMIVGAFQFGGEFYPPKSPRIGGTFKASRPIWGGNSKIEMQSCLLKP